VQWRALLTLAGTWQQPHFPLDGLDVMALGVEEGPRIGHILADIEEWWLARDFQADRAALLARLNAIVRVKGG
jgi:poly(A) polymerase